MQTILGAGGVIGRELAKTLPQYTDKIRLVSRNPQKVNDSDELFAADLLDAEAVKKAVAGSSVVYLVAGLPYKYKVWQTQWPAIMQNVIAACKQHKAKLVFFDNIYAYGLVNGEMTENTPLHPTSRKGEVRAQIIRLLMQEVENGQLEALVARAPDFYGPATPLSFTTALIFERLAKGKRAQWMLAPAHRHMFIYTPDAGKATALLGNTPSAFNQTWHLPVPKEPVTGYAFIEKAAAAYNGNPKPLVLSKFMFSLGGLFNSLIRESREMLYQYEHDYLFNCEKFVSAFPQFAITGYDEGIKATAAFYHA